MVQQTLSDKAAEVGDVVRKNPLPLAMIGVGLGWLAFAATRRSAPPASEQESPEKAIARTASRIEELANNVAEELRSGASDAADEAVARLREGSAAGSDAADRATGLAADIYERASDLAGEASDAVRDVGDTIGDFVERYPLAVGGIAAVVGALLAFGLPATEPEDRVLGSTRDSLRDRALESGREALTRVEDTAGRAAAAALDAAREEIEADEADPS